MRKADLSVLPIASADRALSSLPSTSHPARQMPLDHAGAKPVRHGDRDLLHDAGYEPLHQLVGAPMEVRRFLRLAIGIAKTLGELHQRGLVHRDLKPASILVNATTGEARLTGIGFASRLSPDRQA